MLENVKVRNFQSLHKVDLELAPFTTIVGASSAGKSALIRALQLLTQNKRGTSFITHGEQTAQVIGRTHNGTVSIKRSRTATGPNEYTIIPNEGEPQTWTKLHGETPEEVTRFLNIPPNKLNVASQFDPPYLLSESAPEAARTLGALTNVHVVMEASRESNKRKLASSAEVRKDKAELDAIKKRLPEFSGLKAEGQKLDEAEKILASARKLEARADELRRLVQNLVGAAQKRDEAEKISAEGELPSMKPIEVLHEAIIDLRDLLVSGRMYEATIEDAGTRQQAATNDIVRMQGQHIALLTEAGTCPTCGQNTKELQKDK